MHQARVCCGQKRPAPATRAGSRLPKFGARSLHALEGVHPDLRRLFERVVLTFDCAILEGARTPERQQELYATGKSKTLDSKHLRQPSGFAHAVDVAPWPLDWEDRDRWYAFAGYVRGIAESLEINVRWGGDWDGDWTFTDQTFHDLPHWELA